MVVEDDARTGELICAGLAARGHRATLVATGSAALAAMERGRFDAAVLDRMLPDMDGMEALRELRRRGSRLPILVLTALGSVTNRVEGLDAGGDDYLVKPFALDELVARLGALHRRIAEAPAKIVIDELEIDLLSRHVHRGGRYVPLQPREFDVLALMARNVGRPITRKMFLEQIWQIHYDPSTNVVDSHVSRLRGKLRSSGQGDPIETIQGIGYRLCDSG
nr:response regulator transcription factor [Sphingomonas chungangi]